MGIYLAYGVVLESAVIIRVGVGRGWREGSVTIWHCEYCWSKGPVDSCNLVWVQEPRT